MSGYVTVNRVVISGRSPVHNQKAIEVADTPEVLDESTDLAVGVTVKAMSTNAGTIYVGGPNVDAANGYELLPSEEHFIETDDVANVFVYGATIGDKVCFSGS